MLIRDPLGPLLVLGAEFMKPRGSFLCCSDRTEPYDAKWGPKTIAETGVQIAETGVKLRKLASPLSAAFSGWNLVIV